MMMMMMIIIIIMSIDTVDVKPVRTWGESSKGGRRVGDGATGWRERIVMVVVMMMMMMIGALEGSIVPSEALSSTHGARLGWTVVEDGGRMDPFDLLDSDAHAVVGRRGPVARSDPPGRRGDVSDESRQDDQSDVHVPIGRDMNRSSVGRGRQDHRRRCRRRRRRRRRWRLGRRWRTRRPRRRPGGR